MTDSGSYRSILRSSAIIGVSQIANILGALVRLKAVAILGGPVGIGLVGLFTSLMQAAALGAALGMGSAGTRQIAAAHAEGRDGAVDQTRRALFWGTLILAFIGAAVFFAFADWVAETVLNDPGQATNLRWLSVGVGVTVATGYQTALLTGTRRIGDIARIGILSSVAGTALGCAVLWVWPQTGIVAIVVAPPVMSLVVGIILVFGKRSPPQNRAKSHIKIRDLTNEWKGLVRLGLAFTFTGLVTLVGHLVARVYIQHTLGPEALGYFQAAWNLSATCLGLVLGAMGTDYFPRLSASIKDPATATMMINQQTEVGLLLCAPLFLGLLGFLPWIVHLAYSKEFMPAMDILRYQILGDILKILSWPLGVAIMARGSGGLFFLTEALGVGLLIALIAIGIPFFGIEATGIAFLVMNAVYLPVVWYFGGRPLGFRWTTGVKLHATALFTAAVFVDLAGRYSALLGAAFGTGVAISFGIFTIRHLSHRTGTVRFAEALGGRKFFFRSDK